MTFSRLETLRTFVAALLLTTTFAAGFVGYLVADTIDESVELLNLNHAAVTVTYDFTPSPEYVAMVDEATLEGRFELFPHTYSRIAKEQDKIRFIMGEVPRIAFKAFRIDTDQVEIDFGLHYKSKQFGLVPGVFSNGRVLRLTLPSLYTLRVANVTDQPLNMNFTVTGARADLAGFVPMVPGGGLTVGDTVRLRRTESAPDVTFCIAVLAAANGAEPSVRDVGSSCERLVLPTDASLDAGDYELQLIGVGNEGMAYARHELMFRPTSLPIRLSIARPTVVPGGLIVIDVVSDEPLDGCMVSVYDAFGRRMDRSRFDICGTVALGTSTSWAPGDYVVQVEGYHGNVIGRASMRVELLHARGILSGETKSEKTTYTAGETVRLHSDVTADVCHVQVFNEENVMVADLTSVGCGNAELELDRSLPAGTYAVQNTAYQNNRPVAQSSLAIEVSAWRPPPRTPLSEMCDGGFKHVMGSLLPCIEAGQTCFPSSTDIPLCLCFDGGTGDIMDVCEFGHYCNGVDCRSRRIESPYIIVRSGGSCVAKNGLQILSCIDPGELCMGQCVCLDRDASPVSTCAADDVCTPNGCRVSRLEFDSTGMEPDHVLADDLAEEGVNVTWRGRLRSDDDLLGKDALAELSANASLATLDPSNGPTIRTVGGRSDPWEVTATFRGELEPGRHETMLVMEYGEGVHAVRRPFDVWYPSERSLLLIAVRDIDPTQVRPMDFKEGFSMEVTVDVLDAQSMAQVRLPESSLAITLGGLNPVSQAVTYNHVSGMYLVSAAFLSDALPTTGEVVVSAEHLGRTGQVRDWVSMVSHLAPELQILRTNPGSDYEPLYHFQVTRGFALEFFLGLTGIPDLSEGDLRVHLANIDITDHLEYMRDTSSGLRLHLSDVSLCPDPPAPGDVIELRVDAQTPTLSVSTSAELTVHANPGNYEVLCP